MHMLPRVLAFLVLIALATPAAADDRPGWEKQAAAVTIVRDDWGIAHVHGKTDADAVFGMVYAQAEDDFNRVETNYINAMGRLAEAEGETAIWQDLRMKLFIDPAELQTQYAQSPAWLQTLMTAWADGLNYYLATHPKVTPRVIRRFEPWMALSFTEGSIGGDIESISLPQLEAFYGGRQTSMGEEQVALARFREPSGSNGFAIAPANTTAGHALLLINPHTSFFFRSEQQVSSDEGLNVYGAATWGQFFIYQGFNANAGWMHTSSGVDVIDEFAETLSADRLTYRYGAETRPVASKLITVPYRAADGSMKARTFTTYRTHHGPIVREADGKAISVALMHRPIAALSQSFLRTKATDYASYMKVMALQANSSNNTLFADSKGAVAYLHPQFIPRRDDRFDYRAPVDGANPDTDWKGLHAVTEAPHVLSPPNGWITNTNNWPYSAAGAYSPRQADFPRYMDSAGENPRGIHAIAVLKDRKDFTLSALLAAAYDPHLTAFDQLIPPLLAAYDTTPATSPLKAKLADQIGLLRSWDRRSSAESEATSLAVFWAEQLWGEVAVAARAARRPVYDDMVSQTTSEQKLAALATASDRLAADFGSWRTPWGEINRFQRLTGDLVQPFSDAAPSLPVPFASAQWGSLASFGAGRKPGTKRYYGTSGNSFVAVVEFGAKVRARAISAGGESGDPASRHFNDQAERYAAGDLREVYFYPEQVAGHTERTYRPGR
ncbi:MAG: penicillin acylase family protein [Phenylobacterium sp.]|uniref:penicillin acylase family protein n=1 Tax=Phenylobacterium sp. TaxID=1871053 RepID=UPI002718A077|nr:penicillin acylase family protein [Phenylobacterium sp.]MDO8911850.1 penicillin acylase family protein [Phenylobacterium sp.]MDP3102264.1 penicillin acylase family protein [Phenylobacterium sp.]